MNSNHGRSGGFTLIEIAIVFAVIALVSGGVVAGNKLIENSKYTASGNQVSLFYKANDEFKKLYGGLAGDISNASSLFNGAQNGNGNGLIETNADIDGDGVGDSVDESIAYWQHLKAANLLQGETAEIAGNLYPKSPLDNAVFTVAQVDGVGITYELSAGDASGTGNPAFRARDAYNFDKKFDDGNPNTGKIRGSGAGCISGSEYALSSSGISCSIQLVGALVAKNEGDSLDQSVSCGTIGQNRTLNSCPTGYTGNVVETCSKSGNWEVTQRDCEPVDCGGGVYNQTRNIGCPSGWQVVPSGSDPIVQICNASGVWEITQNNCQAISGDACTGEGSKRTKTCPEGQSGTLVQTCTGGVWDAGSGCAETMCNDSGTMRSIGYSRTSSCPSGYTGKVTELCDAGGLWKTKYDCISDESISCSTAGSERVLPCLGGVAGGITQRCLASGSSGNTWQDISNTCVIGCGGLPVGYSRISQEPCPAGKKGMQREICTAAGTWELDATSCANDVCKATSAMTGEGNASWSDALVSTIANGTCLTGYSGTATRPCNADGTWGAVIQSCVLQCASAPATTTINYQTAAGASSSVSFTRSGETVTPANSGNSGRISGEIDFSSGVGSEKLIVDFGYNNMKTFTVKINNLNKDLNVYAEQARWTIFDGIGNQLDTGVIDGANSVNGSQSVTITSTYPFRKIEFTAVDNGGGYNHQTTGLADNSDFSIENISFSTACGTVTCSAGMTLVAGVCMPACSTPSVANATVTAAQWISGNSRWESTVTCNAGYNRSVTGVAHCTTGTWNNLGVCSSPCSTPTIANGTATAPVYNSGASRWQSTITCNAGRVRSVTGPAHCTVGTWNNLGICGFCVPGQTRTSTCGACPCGGNAGFEQCNASGNWGGVCIGRSCAACAPPPPPCTDACAPNPSGQDYCLPNPYYGLYQHACGYRGQCWIAFHESKCPP